MPVIDSEDEDDDAEYERMTTKENRNGAKPSPNKAKYKRNYGKGAKQDDEGTHGTKTSGFSSRGGGFSSFASKKRNIDEAYSDTDQYMPSTAEGTCSTRKQEANANDLWTKKYTPFNLVSIFV